jgi:hypothetical protein
MKKLYLTYAVFAIGLSLLDILVFKNGALTGILLFGAIALLPILFEKDTNHL